MPSTSYVPTLLRTSSPTSGGPLAPKQLCFILCTMVEVTALNIVFSVTNSIPLAQYSF
jgi:hypothetical protein